MYEVALTEAYFPAQMTAATRAGRFRNRAA